MSTKKTLKRLALVAVSALGMGLLSVVPANSTLRVPSAISFSGTTGLRAGETKAITVNFTLPTGTVNGDTIAVVARVTSAPAASFAVNRLATADSTGNAGSSASAGYLYWKKNSSGNGSYGTMDVNDNVYNNAGSTSTGTSVNNWTAANVYQINSSAGDSLTTGSLTLSFNPDAAGSYVILVGVGNETSGPFSYDTKTELRDATTANLVANLVTGSTTVTTGGTPDAVTLTAVTSGAPKGSTYGALWKATVTTGGAATNLGSSETFTLASSSANVTFKTHAGGSLTNNTLTSSMFSSGVAYFTVQGSAAETASISISGSGLLPSNVTASGNVTFTTADNEDSAFSIASTTTSLAVNSVATVTAGTYYARPGASSYPIKVTGTAGNVEYVRVTDTYGKFTGKAGAIYDKVLTISSTLGYSTFTLTPLAALAAGDTFTFAVPASTAGVRSVTATATASTATTMTVTNDIRRTAAGGSTSFTATLEDQYGAAMANEVVNVSVSGRNPTTSSTAYTTNSSGEVTHTVTDAGTASVNDVVTFTSNSVSSVSDTGTIKYGTSVSGAVALEGPNTDDTLVTLSEKTDINAGASGAQATVATVTATVTDAEGAVMDGMPVVFTVSGTNCAILSTKQTVYTSAAGTAATSVYKWTNGTCDVTATSGGQSGTDTVHFAQQTADEARILAGTVNGNVITATVTDRYGNPVPSAYVWATRTGGGFFANGASSTSAATGIDGTVQFVYSQDASTAGTVTLQLGSSSSADPEYGQSDASANLVSSTTATDIFTATTTGTSDTAETGVGASLAPAGVNAVTVSVAAGQSPAAAAAEAASDAALEAIDAANAATDAANLAAEAADAATVAAEEARDAADSATAAVEALASEVATLMAALKAQITTLAKTVAKIAKKVKA